MSRYKNLASIYDYLVQSVDFEGWIGYVEEICKKFKSNINNIADLACGTGKTVMPFAKRGYRVTGIDLSQDMLIKAEQNMMEQNLSIDFYCMDIRELDLPYKFDLITCFHDGLNYLLTTGDLKKTFEGVYKHLLPGGLFIFDLNTLVHTSHSKRETTYIDEEDFTLIWDSNFDPDGPTWQINLTGFIREGEHYIKFQETHTEKRYETEEIIFLLKEAGYNILGIYDAFTFNAPHDNSRRIFYAAEKTDYN